MHLFTFDLVSVPLKTTSGMFATTKTAACQRFLPLPSVIPSLFNTLCRVKFITTGSCGSCLMKTDRSKHKLTWNSPQAFQSGVHKTSYPSASRKERTFGKTAQVLVNMYLFDSRAHPLLYWRFNEILMLETAYGLTEDARAGKLHSPRSLSRYNTPIHFTENNLLSFLFQMRWD